MSRSQFDEMRLFELFSNRFQMMNRSQLMKCDRLNRLIKNTYVARQIENEYTSFVESRLDNQNTDDKMIKQNHENESSQTIFACENLYRIFQITSHIKTKRKTRCQHILAANRLINIYRNNDFSQKNLLNRVKEKDCCERKNL
jgi:hypothetical protein